MKKIIFEFKHNKKYKIKGVNLEKCFNNLIKNKIKLKNIIKNQDNTAEFYINRLHFCVENIIISTLKEICVRKYSLRAKT